MSVSWIPGCQRARPPELVVGVLNPPKSLVSWQVRDGVGYVISRQIHRGLVWFNPAVNRLEPFAAKSYRLAEDGKSLAFEIDGTRRFHDGSALNCKIAQKALEALNSGGAEAAFQLPPGLRFSCKAETLVVSFATRVPVQFLETLAHPAAAISKTDGKVGLGPYRLLSQSPIGIELEKVWGSGFSHLEFRVASADLLQEEFARGEVHDILYLGLFQSPQAECQIISGLIPTSFWFNMNAKQWALEKREVRRALQILLAKTIADSELFSAENHLWSLIPPSVPGFHRERGLLRPSRSEAENAKLLLGKEVARKGKLGFVLRRSMANEYNWDEFFNQMDPQREIFSVEFLDNDEYFRRYYKGQITLSFLGSNVSRNDPFEILDLFRHLDAVNPAGVVADFVTTRSTQASAAVDLEQMAALAREADAWLIEQAYVVPLFSKRFRGCVNPRLHGYIIDPRGPLAVDYAQVQWK
jgi:ABC-type transport system substrate-binding protein